MRPGEGSESGLTRKTTGPGTVGIGSSGKDNKGAVLARRDMSLRN